MRYRDRTDDNDDDDGVLEMSIVGDEEEQHRIELEHNLQDLSIQFSISNPSQVSDHERSVERRFRLHQASGSSFELEYPRHNPRPRDVSIFHGQNSSFLVQPQMEENCDPNYYSYRAADDDDGVHYVGNTMSTAAHHASAVTLSAGLGGRSGKRVYGGDASLSGAEYDPDRPLDTVMNGMTNDLSMLNMNTSRIFGKDKSNASSAPAQVTFDPVGDHDISGLRGTAHGHTDARSANKRSQGCRGPYQDPTPKAKPRLKRPALNVQPPTPSSAGNATNGSKFTKLAKNLAKEIEASQRWTTRAGLEDFSPVRSSRRRQSTQRSPFRDVANHSLTMSISRLPPEAEVRPSVAATSRKKTDSRVVNVSRHGDRSHSRIISLPDVTGLTSAIDSPLKKDSEWHGYVGGDEGQQVEAQLLQTLTSLQTRLNQLESQNLVSRRRVRELEVELEACKAEVKRERTRVLEREEIIVAQQKDFQKRRSAPSRPTRTDPGPPDGNRYNEVIEEKRALEALIATLRSHLSRLTDELTSQQVQLDELRSMRECDLRNLRDKISEVDHLKLEVERLGGEVEILRGVVEEGLKERRRIKESIESANISVRSISRVPPAQQSLNGEDTELRAEPVHDCRGDVTYEPSRVEIPSPPPSRPQSRQERRPDFYDKTIRTDFATVGSSHAVAAGEGCFIDKDELERVSAEVEERRSDRSELDSRDHSQDHSLAQASCPKDLQETCTIQSFRYASSGPARSKITDIDHRSRARIMEDSPRPPRQYAKTPAHDVMSQKVEVETPFPQIRGERLERLFFSAPEHNAKTCRVCHRRRRPGISDDELDFPSWLPPRKRARFDKEGGRSVRGGVRLGDAGDSDDNTRGLGGSKAPFSEDRLPPQTVLVRVLRELEDDFTHYKGIYTELADQYKMMDAASNVPKRNVLAEHLKEVINTLEQKGDQIASLYDLLTFKDKPVAESVVLERKGSSPRSSRPSGARRQSGLRKYATYS